MRGKVFNRENFFTELYNAGFECTLVRGYEVGNMRGYVNLYIHPVYRCIIFTDNMRVIDGSRSSFDGVILVNGSYSGGGLREWERLGNLSISNVYNGFSKDLKSSWRKRTFDWNSLRDCLPYIMYKCKGTPVRALPVELIARGIINRKNLFSLIADESFHSMVSCLEWGSYLSDIPEKYREYFPEKDVLTSYSREVFKSIKVDTTESKEDVVEIAKDFLKKAYGR